MFTGIKARTHVSTNRYISLTEECIQLNTAFTAISNCLERGLDDQNLAFSWPITWPNWGSRRFPQKFGCSPTRPNINVRSESLGQHLDIARARSLLIFTTLLGFFLLVLFFFLLNTLFNFLLLLRTFRSLWSFWCPLTAFGFLGASTGKAMVKGIQDCGLDYLILTWPPASPFCPFWIFLVSPPLPSSATRKPEAGESGRRWSTPYF